uniref:Cancer/testis antigen 47A n=1 Tax=Heterocephalus glaber TaxID=10181 RepID=A0A0P6JYB2_HETGA
MSASGNEDPTPNDPDSPVSPAVEWAVAAGVREGKGPDSGTGGGGAAQATCEAQVTEPGLAGEVVGPEARSLCFSSLPSMGPAEEEPQEEVEEEVRDCGANQVVDARQFPLVNFQISFLDLVRSHLQRIYYKNHVLIHPYWNALMLQPRPPRSASHLGPGPDPDPGPSELPVLHMLPWPRGVAPRQDEGQDEDEGQPEAVVSIPDLEEGDPTAVLALTSEEPLKETAKSREQMADSKGEEWMEVSENLLENRRDDDEDVGGEEEKEAKEESEKENKNQQEPEKDPDPAGGSLGKASTSED